MNAVFNGGRLSTNLTLALKQIGELQYSQTIPVNEDGTTASIGNKADSPWSGSGNATLVSILKAIHLDNVEQFGGVRTVDGDVFYPHSMTKTTVTATVESEIEEGSTIKTETITYANDSHSFEKTITTTTTEDGDYTIVETPWA